MDLAAITNDTLAKAAALLRQQEQDGLRKATIDASTGLTGYNLDAPAKLMVPLLSPFRQTIGRVVRKGTGTNWKRITGVSYSGTLKSTDGTRSSGFTITTDTGSAVYAPYGQFGDVTWEGVQVSGNFEDARARAETLNLLKLLQREDACILGGLAGTALGAGPTPTLAAVTTGGAMSDAAANYIYLVPLTGVGALGASRIARPTAGNKYDCTVPPTLNLLDGVGLPTAANTTVALAAGTAVQAISVTWTWAAGAQAYAVYRGTASGSANSRLQCIVTQSTVILTAVNTTGAAPPTSDTSNVSPFTGIHGQLVAAASGAYVANVNAPLSAAVGRGIPEIDAMLNDIYDRCKEDPDRLLMNWQEHQTIDDALAAVANDRIKFNINVSPNQSAEAMPRFTTYKSSRGKVIQMEESSNLPGGAIYALKDGLQIPNSEIPAAWQMHMASDLVRLDYAFANPKYEFEVRAMGALAGYAPSFQGALYNIKKF